MQVGHGNSFAITRQVQEHILITEASTILVLDEWVAIYIQLDLTTHNEKHAVSIVATPIEHIALHEFHVGQAAEQLPHEVVVRNSLKELNAFNQLPISDEKDLVSEHRRQRLD